jgi:hypothetical protein
MRLTQQHNLAGSAAAAAAAAGSTAAVMQRAGLRLRCLH